MAVSTDYSISRSGEGIFDGGPSSVLAFFGFMALLLLPPNLLEAAGYSYIDQGGPVFEKLHPASYLIVLAGLVRSAQILRGRSFQSFYPQALWGIMIYILAILSMFAAGSIQGTSQNFLSFYIDSLLVPGFLLLCLITENKKTLSTLAWAILAAEFVNAVVGIGESLSQTHLLPVYGSFAENAENSEDFDPSINSLEFRALALHGHPLANGLITSAALLAFYDAFASLALRLIFRGMLLCALLAFGGRTAFVTVLVLLPFLHIPAIARAVNRRELRYDRVAALLIMALVIPLSCWLLLSNTNLGSRIFENFFWDESAEVRFTSLGVLDLVNADQITFGVPRTTVELFERELGIPGFENFWVLLFLRSGLVGLIPFLGAFGWLMVRLWRLGDVHSRFAIIAFLAISSSNNSLATKSNGLAVIVAFSLCATALSSQSPRRFSRTPFTGDASRKRPPVISR
jgi:hypothetical protein